MDPVIVPHIITALLALGMAIAFLAADRRSPTSRALALFLGTVGIAIAVGTMIAPRAYADGIPAWGGVFALPETLAFVFAYEWLLRVRRTVPARNLNTEGPDRLIRIAQGLAILYGLLALAFPEQRAAHFSGELLLEAGERRQWWFYLFAVPLGLSLLLSSFSGLLLLKRRPFLTAKRLLTNQTFRDLYRPDSLVDVDQRLKITSLTFLFTDLKGSTELYERVGDLAAYDLVKAHFGVLNQIVAGESGAVVKTIGDAVMATFPAPERGLSAALRMREAMRALNAERGREDLTLKIGVHEGPCLAVSLNDRLDYFGQTVNIAARVQGLAVSRSIFATQPVVEHPAAARVLSETGLTPQAQQCTLRGISDNFRVYEIP